MRSTQSGFRLVAMHDPVGRRGVWYRRGFERIEIAAGRDGDDAGVVFRVGDEVTDQALFDLEDCLSRGAGEGTCVESHVAERPPLPTDPFMRAVEWLRLRLGALESTPCTCGHEFGLHGDPGDRACLVGCTCSGFSADASMTIAQRELADQAIELARGA